MRFTELDSADVNNSDTGEASVIHDLLLNRVLGRLDRRTVIDRYAYWRSGCAYSEEQRKARWMNIRRVLCNMGNWEKQSMFQRPNPGTSLVP